MTEPFFKIQGTTVNAAELQAAIDAAIKRKESEGVYAAHNLDALTPFDVLDIQDESQFLDYYLTTIRKTWAIDINDFTIPRKPGWTGRLEQKIKNLIWKALKFYTYRLWSQQREFNSQASQTLIALHKESRHQLDALKAELDQLEKSGRPTAP